MKKIYKSLSVLFLLVVSITNIVNAQSTQAGLGPAGHTALPGGVPIRYLGWDASFLSNAIPLSIEHRGTNNINFRTGNIQRMTILGTASGSTQGFVGINIAAPQSYLHINDGVVGRMFQLTNVATGTTMDDGFLMQMGGLSITQNQQENHNIFFNTGDVASGFNFERMVITGIPGPTQGFIGMGNGFSTPLSLLHLNGFGNTTGNLFRTDGDQAVRNQWQMFNGTSATTTNEIGVIFTDPTTSSQLFAGQQPYNHLNFQATQGDIVLRANGYNLVSPVANPREVMRITRTQYQQPNVIGLIDEGRVSITRLSGLSSGIVNPLAMLHIGDQFIINPPYNNPNGVAGWRPWMDVGTYYAYQSDNLYVGIKPTVFTDVSDAVIVWGNNPSNSSFQGDRLKFIFTAAAGNGNASSANGLEVSRMWSDGDEGRTGFGGGSPFNNSFTVVPTNDPGNTVEINSFNAVGASAPNPGFGTGFSGLRFTDLNASSTPYQVNPSNGVLSVDANGDVILVPSGGTGNVTSTCPTVNQIPKMSSPTSLVCSQIFDDGTSVGIAPAPYVLSPLMKLEVKGSVSIYDGTGSNNNGDNSLFFGREQTTLTAPASDLGEWGIQYTPPATIGNPVGGINFWKPFGSDGGFGNNFLYLSNNGNVGIGTPDPINRTEITSGSTVLAPLTSAVVTRSGLRFTNLNATMAVDGPANSSNTFLSVNNTGDVILVPGGGAATTFGAACGTFPQLNLSSDSRVGLNTFNFYFDGNGTGTQQNNVIIGKNCTTPILGKLDVFQNSLSTTGSVGINVENDDFSGNTPATSVVGIRSIMPNTSDFYRIAGMFDAPEIPGMQSTAIFVPQLGGSVSIGYATPYFNSGAMLEVNGQIFAANGLLTPSAFYPSDSQLKTNIQSYTNGLNVIRQIQPVTFNYNGMAFTSTAKTRVGVIAQDIEQISQISGLAVDTFQIKLNPTDPSTSSVLGINTESFIWTAVNAIKELDSIVANQAATIDSLRNQMISCCSSTARTQNPNPTTNQTNVTLDNSQNIVLNQNVPNPFAEQTTITYNLPESVQKAQLLFYDATGKLIKAVDLDGRGNGQVNVFANDLSNGIYSYALVVDGQIADTKRMVKAK